MKYEHGTMQGYRNDKCRCDPCRDAQRAYARKRYATNPGRKQAAQRRWLEKNREKHAAHHAVYWLLQTGWLVKPATCERCGADEKLDGSHDDYAKPLDVEWLCRPCHKAKDRKEI